MIQLIMKYWNRLMQFFGKSKEHNYQPIETPPTASAEPQKKARRQRVRSLWPQISDAVEKWEAAFKDKRITNECKSLYGESKQAILESIYENVPPWGVYCLENSEWEMYERDFDESRIDPRAPLPKSLCVVHIPDKTASDSNEENIFNYGVSGLYALPALKLHEGTWAMNEGILYDLKITHWDSIRGHDVFVCQVILSQSEGRVYPTWRHVTNMRSIKPRRGSPYTIPSRTWEMACWPKATQQMAAWMSFEAERNAHWGVAVAMEGIPPIAFPVREHDIARVFPKRQRDGSGKIVHWVRTHKRKTKAGEIFVRAHISGETTWSIDGRNVSITMPGKHHGLHTTAQVISDPGGDKKDFWVHGRRYSAISATSMMKLLKRAKIFIEQIDVAA